MPVVVEEEHLDQPCTELWADPAILVAEDPTLDPEIAEAAVADATWLLWQLTENKLHGWQCWVEDYAVQRDQCRMAMEQWPVHEILSVSTIDLCAETVGSTGVGDEIDGWCYLGAGEIKICCGIGLMTVCSCTPKTVRVHYRTKPNLPPGAARATLRLAREYVKAVTGGACKLPERITSVTRQGVTWTILDPQDFLEKGLLGIGPVDAWIAAVRGKGGARLIDPLKRAPLVASVLVGCGPDCGIEEE